jgi:hypothetical protein
MTSPTDVSLYSFNSSLYPLPGSARSAITASKQMIRNLIEGMYGITDFDIVESDSGGGQPLVVSLFVLFTPDDLFVTSGLSMTFACVADGLAIGITGHADSKIIPEFSMTCDVSRFSANIIAAFAMLIISTMELPKETA